MNKIERQILKNQLSIIGALETLLINTGLDVSNQYDNLSKNFIDTIFLIDEEAKDEQIQKQENNNRWLHIW